MAGIAGRRKHIGARANIALTRRKGRIGGRKKQLGAKPAVIRMKAERKARAIAARSAMRAYRRQGIVNPIGQLNLVRALFTRHGAKYDPKRDIGREKVWMKKGIGSVIENEIRKYIYGETPPGLVKVIRELDEKKLVQEIAEKYGGLNGQNFNRAKAEAERVVSEALKRADNAYLGQSKVRAMEGKFKNKRQKFLVANTVDAFADGLSERSNIQTLLERLKELKR